jgi:hypothetical protein
MGEETERRLRITSEGLGDSGFCWILIGRGEVRIVCHSHEGKQDSFMFVKSPWYLEGWQKLFQAT